MKTLPELQITRNKHGIDASALYVILESMGHKNIRILRANVKEISELDPNWKIYKDYLEELASDDLNKTSLKSHSQKIIDKINILKPHLLIQDDNENDVVNKESNYTVTHTNIDFFLSKEALRKAVKKIRAKESNLTIIDACEMIDIVGNNSGSYISGVKSLSWKSLIDTKTKYLKSNERLERLFNESKIKKDEQFYIYCMSSPSKAFYVMVALRELGYSKVKVFTGDWNTWIGDINE